MSGNRLRHIAIIMDGNNRWARQQGKPGPQGHKAGVERIRDVMDACRRHRVEVLTLFAFSSENWQRPRKEVEALLNLFLNYLRREARKLAEQGVRLRVVGRRDRFSDKLNAAIDDAEALATDGDTTLVIAADYGGQWDMANAARRLAEQVAAGQLQPGEITVEAMQAQVALADLPPPDLLIRTGGEQRISNFLLWQAAYSELYFCDCYWPDFDEAELDRAVADFQRRQRRFGKTSNSSPQEA